jgi:ankyrin repeat protein
MSYTQTFKGAFHYANDHRIEAALDAFVSDLSESVVDLRSLKLRGSSISIAVDCSAPASMYDETLMALGRLGDHATSGSIATTFHLDGISRERVGAAGVWDTAGLPPRHHRWDVFRAAREGDAAKLRALVAAGSSLDVTYPSFRGWTSLHLAAAAGASDAARVLLETKLAIDATGERGETPLAVAATAKVAELLLEAGADPAHRLDGRSLLLAVSDAGRDDVVALLLARGIAIAADEREALAESCASGGRLATLRALVDHDPRMTEVLRAPAVMKAAVRGGEPVLLDYVLEHGAEPPATLLEDAIDAGALALVELALGAPGAIAGCGPSSNRDDAMCVAAAKGQLEVMQLLARYGVPIHPVTPGDTTPIHRAACSFDDRALACVDWLLEQGVSVTATDGEGNTVLADAVGFGRTAMLASLVERGADPAEIAYDEMASEDAETLRRLLRKQAAPRRRRARKLSSR